MDRIRQLWNTFSNSEKRYLRIYIEAFHRGSDNTALSLIQLLERKPDITQEEASQKLYGKKRTQAFSMLKGRLMDRMFDVLSLSVNLQNHPLVKEDPSVVAKVQLYKHFLASLLVKKRGLNDLAHELAQKVRTQSEALDYPEGLLLSLPFIASHKAAKGKPVKALWDVVDHAILQFKNDLTSLGFFEEYRALYSGHSGKDQERIEFLNGATKDIQLRLEEAYSSRSHYYYLHLLMEKATEEGDTESMREILFELLDLLDSNEGLNQKNRQTITSYRLAKLELKEKHYQAAYEAATKARDNAPARRTNSVYAHLIFIYAAFFTNNLQQAEEALNTLSDALIAQSGELNMGIFTFIRAIISYAKGDIFDAKASIMDADALYQDKHGWNLGLRIFDIVLHIDMRKHDLAESMIGNLRKHVQRYAEEDSREMAMYRYLNALCRAAFNFEEALETGREFIEKLNQRADWEPYGHEPIPYHVWITSKTEHESPYTLLLAEIGS